MDYPKIASFKTLEEFRDYLRRENIRIGLADEVRSDGTAALAQKAKCFGRTAGNRWAILPMEGWDCEPDGNPGEFTRRRWLRFAASGAKLLYGTEAAAVMHSARSNPRQLTAQEHTLDALKKLCAEMRRTHKEKFGTDDDLVIGLQLTHSGRYAHPNQPHVREAKTAYAHPLLDRKFGCSPANVVTDAEVHEILNCFIRAAEVAQKAGFDFVDIKHAHGYLGHEFLSAHDRPGPYGGSFENRTRFFREIADGIRKKCPGLYLSARVSLFDILPYVKGEDGLGHPMEWSGPYPYAFGGDGTGKHMDPGLKETVRFVNLLREYGVDTICATIGSPYYNVHMQRPAYYPVSDGYPPPENPLYNVSRHLAAVKRIRELCPEMLVVGSGYTCLQDYLPNAAEYSIAHNEADFVGIGRMVLSYPEICADVLAGKPLDRRRICRTFGDCTNAPRAGMISGCYPLDDFYRKRPEAEKLKNIKQKRP
ncbi:MAG: NADPH dehydrogenase [Lentisphaerae bacterium ADurb.Bin242]|nr:MAG: NADPH dehydrogenase [Lentisphaerae bacterium ADurb.Bin242]